MPEKMVVCCDPGHSDPDPGAIGPSGVQEKVITLAIALRVADILRPVVDVVMTRTSDTDVSLERRAQIANDAGADLFLSIHANAHTDPSANGTETYHYPGSEAGKELAGAIQFDLVTQLKRRDRGVRNANFAVLRETNMPAALAEIAFISNPEEEALLETPAFQAKAAYAIATGIAGYLGIMLPTEEKLTPILGQPVASLSQARQFLRVRAPEWVLMADLYYTIAPKYGVRPDVALAQACKETGYFRFGGDVKPGQNNFAGLGATGKGNPGASFPDRSTGVEAHIQHAHAYATKDQLPAGVTLVDPRFHMVKRGSAHYVEHLGAAENPAGVGWAYPGRDYGHSIVRDYLAPMMATEAMPEKDVIVPDWANRAVLWAIANGLITEQDGSEDFYRFLTVIYRYDLLKK